MLYTWFRKPFWMTHYIISHYRILSCKSYIRYPMKTTTENKTNYGCQCYVWLIYKLNTLNNMIDNNMTAALILDVGYKGKKLDFSYEMITKLIHYCILLYIKN